MIPLQIRDTNFLYHKVGNHDELFNLSDSDDAADVKYYGYLSASGYWIIMQETTSTGAYRYCAGLTPVYKTAVTGAWAIRATLTYEYYNELFS